MFLNFLYTNFQHYQKFLHLEFKNHVTSINWIHFWLIIIMNLRRFDANFKNRWIATVCIFKIEPLYILTIFHLIKINKNNSLQYSYNTTYDNCPSLYIICGIWHCRELAVILEKGYAMVWKWTVAFSTMYFNSV